MHVTERQHHIGCPRRADLGKLRRMQFGDDHLAEVSRIVRDPLAQHGRIVLSLLPCARYIGSLNGGVVLALFAQVGGQDFHIPAAAGPRSEEHTSELQSQSNLVCRLLLEKKKTSLSNA